MEIKEIHVSVKFVKNLGNYQSFAAEAAVTANLDSGEKPAEAFEAAWGMAKEQVTQQIKSLKGGGLND